MKLYDIKDDCVCSFNAELNKQNIYRIKRSLYNDGVMEKKRIDITEVNKDSIKNGIIKLNLLPTDIICNLDDLNFESHDLHYSRESDVECAEATAEKYFTGYLIVKRLPVLYHIFFDSDGNIHENVVENLIQYLKNEFTLDFHIRYERKIELIKKFFALLEIELESVCRVDAIEESLGEENFQIICIRKEAIQQLKDMLNNKEEVIKKEMKNNDY